ncbi:hypothetical protein ACH42_14470 [Endozoicomonas sp. (ex Bugula neritina AB1)]|nr:hypothetical protein ACH42_14470 [Endozoicomonas sp. (ex Bugula neritina AB1)]
MRLQKLVVMMALAGALGAANVNALGLGEVKLYSSLNQPLVAEIELLQIKDLTKNEILPNLASRSDFERAGVDRPFSLTGLTFKTVLDDDGKRVIRVTSTKPVQEPYLNFLLEVHWPSGRLLREYTVLLDPPAFNDQPAEPVRPPESPTYGTYPVEREVPAGQTYLPPPNVQAPSSYSESVPQQVRKLSPSLSPNQEARRSSNFSSGGSDQYQVQSNDTLWEIAQRVRPGNDVSVQQTMLALQRRNPEAFINGNINRLKRGEVLRLPDRQAIKRMTTSEAIADVARQNKEWRSESRVAQIDATRRSSVKRTSSAPIEDGKLAIVGSDTDTGAGQGQDIGGDKSASNSALQTELAMTRERLDKLTRDNTELTSRLKDLDDQIATLKRLLTLKDDQMAALQSEIVDPSQQYEADQPEPAVAPVSSQESEPQMSFVGSLFSKLLLLLAGLISLGVGGFLFYRKRKQKQEDEYSMDEEEVEVPLDLGVNQAVNRIGEKPTEDDVQIDESLEIDEALLADELADEETTQETEDALSEADIYIAYGRFNQAADLLSQAISDEPQRSDLRLKLLEVHAENNDLEEFKSALTGLESMGDAESLGKAETFKTRFPAGSFEGADQATDDLDGLDDLDLDLDLDGEFEEDDEIKESNGVERDEFEFDLGDLDEDKPAPNQSSESPEAVDDTQGYDLDDLELDDDVEEDSDNSFDEELPDLDLDDLDLDDEEPTEAPIEDAEAAFSEDGGSSLEAAINDDDLDFLSDDDEVATKLDLARAYIDMGDMEGSKDILQEVLEQGSDEQKAEAKGLIDQIGQ